MSVPKAIYVLWLLLVLAFGSLGAGSEGVDELDAQIESERAAEAATDPLVYEQIRSERWYVVSISILALASLAIAFWALKTVPYAAGDVVAASGLHLVVWGTLVLTIVADTTESLTAPIGVLGAVAGYLFGTAQRRPSPADSALAPADARRAKGESIT